MAGYGKCRLLLSGAWLARGWRVAGAVSRVRGSMFTCALDAHEVLCTNVARVRERVIRIRLRVRITTTHAVYASAIHRWRLRMSRTPLLCPKNPRRHHCCARRVAGAWLARVCRAGLRRLQVGAGYNKQQEADQTRCTIK